MTRVGRIGKATVLTTIVVIGVVFACPAAATEADQDQLPITEPFLCLLCHVDQAPDPQSFALNTFGSDYLANARTWDANLAAMDSDGDGCTNGVELGDADGNGESDGNVNRLQSNPGDGTDCGGASVDSRTWGELKALFDRN
jgi:hypothetical protein